MPSENRSQHISELGAKVIEIEKKTRQIEAEMKADVQMLNANGTRTEREMRKIRNNVLIDKQSVGVLNRTLRSLGMGVSTMAAGIRHSSSFMKEYAMAAEEFRLNKQNVAALAISSVAGAPIGYLASKIFETETVKNLMSNIKSKSSDLIKRAIRRDKAQTSDDDFAEIPRMQKGGYVKKGGYAKLHAAEVVMPVEKLLKELQEQRKLNYPNRKMSGTAGTYQSQMAKDIASIAKSTADTHKAIRTMSRGSHNLEKNMVAALGELKVAMIGTTDQWRIKMQSALLRHPIIKKYMMATDMLKTFMSTPLQWLFGKRGGYEGAASAAQKTDNVFEKSSNLLSLIFRYQMPRLDKIINLLQIGFEDKIDKKIKGAKTKPLRKMFRELKRHAADKDESGKGVYTQAQVIKKWMEGKHKTRSMWERFVESDYIGLGTDDLEDVGIGGFGDLKHPGKVVESLGITRKNIEDRKIQHTINALKHKLRFVKSPEKKEKIERQIKALELRQKRRKRKPKETPSMAAGGFIKKGGKIKAHAGEVIMPVEKWFNKTKNMFKQRMYETEEDRVIRKERDREHDRMMRAVRERERANKKDLKETIIEFNKKWFGAGARTLAEKNRSKIERTMKMQEIKEKLNEKKEKIKERKEWLKFRVKTDKNLGTIKDKSTEQVKKTNEVVKEIKDMGGGLFSAIGSILGGVTSMIGGMASSALGSLAEIGGGILGTIGLTKLGGKLGGVGKRVGKKAGFFKGGGLKAGFKMGAAVPSAAGALLGGGINLASKGVAGVGKGLWGGLKSTKNALVKLGGGAQAVGLGGAAANIGKKGLQFAGKTGKFALKGLGKSVSTTAGLGLGLGAGVIGGMGKGALSLLKASAKAGPLAGLFGAWDAYDMMGEAKDMGVSKASAGISGLLTSGREGGIGQGIWGLFKGAGLGALVGGALGTLVGGPAGTAVGAALGAKIGTVGIGALSYFGGDKLAKSIDGTVTSISDYMGTISDKISQEDNGFDLNEDPWALDREQGGGLGSLLTKIFNPDAGLTAAEQIDKLKARLKSDPSMLPTQKREIEEKIQELEMKSRNSLYTSRFYDPKEGKETKTYQMDELERIMGVPLVAEKDRKPTSVAREYTKGNSSKELTEKLADKEAVQAKQMKDIGTDIVQPMVDQMDIAQKGMEKSNKMLANTIINSSQVITNTIVNNSANGGGGGQGGYGFGAGSGDLARILSANVS